MVEETAARIESSRRQFVEGLRERVLPLRQQADLRNTWLKERLDTLLPELMEKQGIDMWIVDCREYNEDPVIMTLLPEPNMSARRRTVLLMNRRPDGSVERLTVTRFPQGEYFAGAWNPDEEEQDAALTRLVRERDPRVIGIDVGREFAFGDGLSYNEHEWLMRALGDPYSDRVTSAESLAVGWLERRIAPELEIYSHLAKIAHDIIDEAYSPRVIVPGTTTTDDVVWWMRQTMHDAGLRAWFPPTIDIQAIGEERGGPGSRGAGRNTIQPGDLLHCDVGFIYLGLATDHQQNAYVLKPGETDAPEGLKAALAAGNRLQDIHLEEMRPGRSGNEVLADTLRRANAEEINPQVYSHPIGYHGHAAGPIVGLWDHQEGVPGRGDYPVYDNTCYSIELNVKAPVAEWGNQTVTMALEEDAMLAGGTIAWLDGRQERLHLI